MPLNWSILPIRSSLVDVEGLGLAGLAELIQGLTGIGVVDNINNIWQYVIMYLINKHSQSATILVYHTSQLQSLGSADACGPKQLILAPTYLHQVHRRTLPTRDATALWASSQCRDWLLDQSRDQHLQDRADSWPPINMGRWGEEARG